MYHSIDVLYLLVANKIHKHPIIIIIIAIITIIIHIIRQNVYVCVDVAAVFLIVVRTYIIFSAKLLWWHEVLLLCSYREHKANVKRKPVASLQYQC